jgi:hypothetical protein
VSGKYKWEPVDDKTATELIGTGVHTGLRKGSEAPSSAALWRAIHDSDDGAWDDALRWCMWAMREMGYDICQKVKP